MSMPYPPSLVRPSLTALAVLACTASAANGQERTAEALETHEVEEVIVQSTRSGRRVQDEPIRVEVINREEIEDELTFGFRVSH